MIIRPCDWVSCPKYQGGKKEGLPIHSVATEIVIRTTEKNIDEWGIMIIRPCDWVSCPKYGEWEVGPMKGTINIKQINFKKDFSYIKDIVEVCSLCYHFRKFDMRKLLMGGD
jgi:hypothetical protein